jgi:hypothetical protein
MISDERIDQEPTGPEEGQQVVPKGTQFLKKGYRDLDEGELTSPVAVRFMLAEVDRLNADASELRTFRERSAMLETRVAVLEEKLKTNLSLDVLAGASLTIGAAMIGYSRYLWEYPPNGYFGLGFGAVLIILGIAGRAIRR